MTFDLKHLFQILHCLGFFHEHQRPARDNYIDIDFRQIESHEEFDFLKRDRPWNSINSTSEYDYKSIMHYDSYVNGYYRFNPVLTKKDGSIIQPNKQMSDLDIQTLNKMYPCQTQNCDSSNFDQGK